MDAQLTRDLIAEEYPMAERQAQSLGLALRRHNPGEAETDLFVTYVAPDGETYLLRLRCDGYDGIAPSFQFVNPGNTEETGAKWWPRFASMSHPRGDNDEIVFCVAGIREYHRHPQHLNDPRAKELWKLARVVSLAWNYLNRNGPYVGRGAQ